MRLLFLGAVFVHIAAAQYDIHDLTTTGDGGAAYFVTALPEKGSGGAPLAYPDAARIYTADAGGVRLQLERKRVEPPPVTAIGQIGFTNYYALSSPQVSRDGSVVAVTGQRQCIGGSRCASMTTLQTTVTYASGAAREVVGGGRLSGNGRYLFVYGYGTIGSQPPVLLDLGGGNQTVLDMAPASYGLGAGRVVADDGTVVVGEGGLRVVRASGSETINVGPGSAQEAVIDAAARVVVYARFDWATSLRSIRVYRIAEKSDAPLAVLPGADSISPYVSADGSRALFRSNASGVPQIYTVNIDGSGLRQVSRDASGVLAAAMSDNGKVAWYLSGAGRLYRMDLETGLAEERMGRTPQLTMPSRMAAGSVYTILGAGLSDRVVAATAYPLPRSLGEVSVSVGGVDVPLLSVTPTAIVLQVPWQVAGSTDVEVKTASSSPFEAHVRLAMTVLTAYPQFLSVPQLPSGYGGWGSLAIHQGWDAVVGPANPAHPGEVIHFYGTGFGRVDAPPAEGTPAPANPPARTVLPVNCWAWAADNVTRLEVPVLFSGLAPGTTGYYQLDVRLPAGNLRRDTQLACSGEGDTSNFFGSVNVAW